MDRLASMDLGAHFFFQNQVRRPWLDPVAKGITFLGNEPVLMAVTVLAALLFLVLSPHPSGRPPSTRVDMAGSFSVFPEFGVANNPMMRSIAFMVLPLCHPSRGPGSSPTVGSPMGRSLTPGAVDKGTVEQCSPRRNHSVSPPFFDVWCTVLPRTTHTDAKGRRSLGIDQGLLREDSGKIQRAWLRLHIT